MPTLVFSVLFFFLSQTFENHLFSARLSVSSTQRFKPQFGTIQRSEQQRKSQGVFFATKRFANTGVCSYIGGQYDTKYFPFDWILQAAFAGERIRFFLREPACNWDFVSYTFKSKKKQFSSRLSACPTPCLTSQIGTTRRSDQHKYQGVSCTSKRLATQACICTNNRRGCWVSFCPSLISVWFLS